MSETTIIKSTLPNEDATFELNFEIVNVVFPANNNGVYDKVQDTKGVDGKTC